MNYNTLQGFAWKRSLKTGFENENNYFLTLQISKAPKWFNWAQVCLAENSHCQKSFL